MEDLERQINQASSKQSRWAAVSVVPQSGENTDTPIQARAKWSKIYALFGATGETQQDEVFGAVNLYFLRNGASPYGKYSKPIRTAGGVEVPSGEVVKITGKLEGELRAFLRGRLQDSYMFLKYNPAITSDEALATVAENAAVPREMCWLLADWLGKDCEYFVGQESEIYRKLRSVKIALAYDKRAVATSPSQPLREYAPETQVVKGRTESAHYNTDLF